MGGLMLGFKEESDLLIWRKDGGDKEVRRWISLFNAISEVVSKKSAMVTSWYRKDRTAHKMGLAVDFRTRIYSDRQLEEILGLCVSNGMPVSSLYRGSPSQHIHCGDLMTKKFEREIKEIN
jgi:hypothetical protein